MHRAYTDLLSDSPFTLASLAPAVTLYLPVGLLLVNWWSQKSGGKDPGGKGSNMGRFCR